MFGNGLWIRADQNKQSLAIAMNNLWVHPENTGNLTSEHSYLYFAGSDDGWFNAVDVEVWGLH